MLRISELIEGNLYKNIDTMRFTWFGNVFYVCEINEEKKGDTLPYWKIRLLDKNGIKTTTIFTKERLFLKLNDD